MGRRFLGAGDLRRVLALLDRGLPHLRLRLRLLRPDLQPVLRRGATGLRDPDGRRGRGPTRRRGDPCRRGRGPGGRARGAGRESRCAGPPGLRRRCEGVPEGRLRGRHEELPGGDCGRVGQRRAVDGSHARGLRRRRIRRGSRRAGERGGTRRVPARVPLRSAPGVSLARHLRQGARRISRTTAS